MWEQYKKLILREMQETDSRFHDISGILESIRTEMASMKVDIAGLKVKAAIAGGAAGIIGAAVVTFLFSLWK